MKAIDTINAIQALVARALIEDHIQTKGIPRSIRFPADIDDALTKAASGLKCDRTEIVVACVKKNFAAVIDEMVVERREAAGRLVFGSSEPRSTPHEVITPKVRKTEDRPAQHKKKAD